MNNPIIVQEPFVSQAAKEFIDAYPELARAVNGRIENAIALAATGKVFDQGVLDYTPTFLVESETSQTFYTVQGRGETWQNCGCQDSQRGNRCQHALAVILALRAVELKEQFQSEWEVAFEVPVTREEVAR